MNEASPIVVRILVAVAPDGSWSAAGWKIKGSEEQTVFDSLRETLLLGLEDCPPGEQFFWVEAMLPSFAVPTIPGEVSIASEIAPSEKIK